MAADWKQVLDWSIWYTDAGEFLLGSTGNLNSQFGEDGLIAAAFRRFGVANQWCFEVGAHNGEYLSNTLCLRDHGWTAVLIEADPVLYEELAEKANGRTFCFNAIATGPKLDELLAVCNAPLDLDFGCIDVDGQDYWVWKRFEQHKPRVMMVEFATSQSPSKLPTEAPESINDVGDQAGYSQIQELGESKGYVPLIRTTCNMIFVRGDILCSKP